MLCYRTTAEKHLRNLSSILGLTDLVLRQVTLSGWADAVKEFDAFGMRGVSDM